MNRAAKPGSRVVVGLPVTRESFMTYLPTTHLLLLDWEVWHVHSRLLPDETFTWSETLRSLRDISHDWVRWLLFWGQPISRRKWYWNRRHWQNSWFGLCFVSRVCSTTQGFSSRTYRVAKLCTNLFSRFPFPPPVPIPFCLEYAIHDQIKRNVLSTLSPKESQFPLWKLLEDGMKGRGTIKYTIIL